MTAPRATGDGDRPGETVTGPPSPYLDNGYSVVGWPVCPGLYAGRIGDLVKIGQSMNLPQRIDSFHFQEIIGIQPFPLPPRTEHEHPEDHALRVKRLLLARERALHGRLESLRVRRQRRANANEWFQYADDLVRVLFEEGWIVARNRVEKPLGTRFGRQFWPSPVPFE